MTFQQGDRVEYVAEPVFDLIIKPDSDVDLGLVSRFCDGWEPEVSSSALQQVSPGPDAGS